MVLHYLLSIYCGLGVVLAQPSETPDGRIQTFYEAMRGQMVAGKAYRGPDIMPGSFTSARGKLRYVTKPEGSAIIAVEPNGVGGYFVSAASFGGPYEPERPIREDLAMNPNRVPGLLTALARAAGLEGELRIYRSSRVAGTISVYADMYWNGHLFIPARSVSAEIDYETGQLERWRAFYGRMPQDPPPKGPGAVIVRDRILQTLLLRRDVAFLENVRMIPTVSVLAVQENEHPNRVTFASSARRNAAREHRAIYTWMLTADTPGHGGVNAVADFATGEFLEYDITFGSTGGFTDVPTVSLPLLGPYTLISQKRNRTVQGGLKAETVAERLEGMVIGLVAGNFAIRAVYNEERALLQTAAGTYRPTGQLRTALAELK